jgi:spore maturation protein CgeB
MTRSRERGLNTYLQTLPKYDVAFIWTEQLFDRLREAGARDVRHLPFAYDPSLHHPVDSSPDYESDVVFAGHWSKKRQRYLSAVADLNVNLAIYGNYWKRKCFDWKVRRCIRDHAIFGEEYSRVFCSSKIALNIVADHNMNAYNMRSFEIPATGSFMATTRTKGQQEIFGEGEGMVGFETPGELQATVKEHLESDQRATIAKRGAEKVQSHTYQNRMQTVVKTVEAIR